MPSITWVWVRSNTELAALWLKSAETSGASLVASTPLSRLDLAAFSIAALISSAVVLREATNLKSIIDTFWVGTRMAGPVELAVELGEDAADRPGGAGRGRDQGLARRPRPPEIAVQRIQDALVAGIGVDGGHVALRHAHRLVEHGGDRGARQLVVQDALETTLCDLRSLLSFTP